MSKPAKNTKRWLFVGAFLLCVIWIAKPKPGQNSLLQWGFPVHNSSVVLDERPWFLKGGEEIFLKANLTTKQGKALLTAFKQVGGAPRKINLKENNAGDSLKYGPSGLMNSLNTQMDDPRWTPNLVKQGLLGGFEKRDQSSLYFCSYIFDTQLRGKTVLYFYAVTFDEFEFESNAK